MKPATPRADTHEDAGFLERTVMQQQAPFVRYATRLLHGDADRARYVVQRRTGAPLLSRLKIALRYSMYRESFGPCTALSGGWVSHPPEKMDFHAVVSDQPVVPK